jgi:DNA-binding transcriptional MerR regulator
MKIGDVSKASGISIDTLRYYEKVGLIDPPWRNGGRRDYPDDIVAWVEFLKTLKRTGMSLSDMARYAQLRREGTSTAATRREMIERQREMVKAKITELSESLELLDFKIANYLEIEARNNKKEMSK